jgi:glycosyltransferase involved in cell wall biosynthesis
MYYEYWGARPPIFIDYFLNINQSLYMSQQKLRILMCSEASFLNSGFGTYTRELLSRLNKTNKYIIAEFASYGYVNDPRDKDIDWIYYANAVRDNDPRYKEYMSRTDNQFGRWRFEKVLLDFKPDVVIDIRDYWMTAYQRLSPLRHKFHWILMPTVDSEPQQEDWIDTFLSADAVFTYSDWGANVLSKQSTNHIKYIDTVSPGIDLNLFTMKDKASIRKAFNLSNDMIIVGSVMRNQKRKLIPELMMSFRQLLDRLQDKDPKTGSRLYLYLHTSYPDMGWDIPELLKDNRIANRVLFSYICKQCRTIGCNTYQGVQTICPRCGNKSYSMPSVTDGFTQENLSDLYNIFDLYVQYAICEGFGMPQVEAGACGVPIVTVDYSAMCDVISKLNAYPIRIQTKFKELETKAFRVYPDNDHLVETILNFIELPEPLQNKKRIETRKLTEQHYDWNTITKKWEKYFDYLDSINYRANWDDEANIMSSIPKNNMQHHRSQNFDLLMNMCKIHLNDNNIAGSFQMLNMLKDADYGFTQIGPTQISPFGYNNLQEYLNTVIANNNQAEQVRSNNMKFDDDFIVYAKLKGGSNG